MHQSNTQGAVEERPEPAWDVAYLFPEQGAWSEQEYLELRGNRLVEFSNGCIEVLAMPTMTHQLIADLLHTLLKAFVIPQGLGWTLSAPFSIRLWAGKFRQPDVIFMLKEHVARIHNERWDGADLVIEVVSDDDRRRDLETKRFEYARAGIAEYWIVDPQRRAITVLKLDGQRYEVYGEFVPGQQATSALLIGFTVDVSTVFEQAPPQS